jgi:glutaredoxin 3
MKGIDVAVHELGRMPNGQSVQNELSRMTGQRTVPSVWVGGKFLGGNDDTQAAASSGKLKEMLGK